MKRLFILSPRKTEKRKTKYKKRKRNENQNEKKKKSPERRPTHVGRFVYTLVFREDYAVHNVLRVNANRVLNTEKSFRIIFEFVFLAATIACTRGGVLYRAASHVPSSRRIGAPFAHT